MSHMLTGKDGIEQFSLTPMMFPQCAEKAVPEQRRVCPAKRYVSVGEVSQSQVSKTTHLINISVSSNMY